ncbi:MAG: hypothetical protein JWO80_1542 [Bryobacterales bacterium]|nr:hypothetical protein [Bryobacterales bacterium]
MIDSGSRSQVRPLESFKRSRFGLLAIASIIIHYFGWQARSRFGGIVRDGDDLLKRIADTKCAQ